MIVGSRDPARAVAAMAEWPVQSGLIPGASYAAAIAEADIVALAVPFETVDSLLEDHRDRFKPNALVIDVTVPLHFGEGSVSLMSIEEGSAAQHIRARLPETARLAVAFKTLPAHVLMDVDHPLDCDEFTCGDSTESRTEAAALVQRIPGLRAVDLGPLTRARSIEHLTLVAVAINRRHKIHDARFRIVGL